MAGATPCVNPRLIHYPIIFASAMNSPPSAPSATAPNFLTAEVPLTNLLGYRCTHISIFACWLCFLICGTTLIGLTANNFTATFPYCSQDASFCYIDMLLNKTMSLGFYARLYPIYQNNRMYGDAYSWDQMRGGNGTGRECLGYRTYGQLGLGVTLGGYRVGETVGVHPCGFPMLNIFNDSVNVITSEGTSPSLDNSIVSNFSKSYRFEPLAKSALTQWTDVESSPFINWFTVGLTSTKYILMGRLENMQPGDYRVIVKNNFKTKEDFSKQIIIAETNVFGITNHLIGFMIFASGIVLLLVHVGLCFKLKQ